MLSTDTLIWMILAGTTVVCVLSILGVFASVVRHQTDLHDLRSRVAELQYGHNLQHARMHGHVDAESESGGVDILDDQSNPEIAEAAPSRPARAAA
jgi:hypothetical protein